MKKLSIKEMPKKRKKKGFTLIELIIVIAIIAILAAMAIPKFGAIKESANTKADIATAKNIALVISTKIANGDSGFTADTTAAQPISTDIKNSIDGGTVPKVSGKTDFEYNISNGNVTIIYKGGGQVYPTGSGS